MQELCGQIYIVGAGGLAREVLAALEAAGERVWGFVVDPPYSLTPVANLPVRRLISSWVCPGKLIIAIGDPGARLDIATRLIAGLSEVNFGTVLHPLAMVGPRVSIGLGSLLIGPLSITVDVEIGEHVLINPGCNIAHDCRIGSFANLGPRVVLAGGVVIEEGASLGAGSVVGPGCTIGSWAVVGAGAVVVRDVQPGTTVVGVPARPISRT